MRKCETGVGVGGAGGRKGGPVRENRVSRVRVRSAGDPGGSAIGFQMRSEFPTCVLTFSQSAGP